MTALSKLQKSFIIKALSENFVKVLRKVACLYVLKRTFDVLATL